MKTSKVGVGKYFVHEQGQSFLVVSDGARHSNEWKLYHVFGDSFYYWNTFRSLGDAKDALAFGVAAGECKNVIEEDHRE